MILRHEHGKSKPNTKLIGNIFCKIENVHRICLILDNATWHNAQTEELKLRKRAWRKSMIEAWLQDHRVLQDGNLTKAEMLELAFKNAPPKEYLVRLCSHALARHYLFSVDQIAARFQVEIVRLPLYVTVYLILSN